jgi:hypothetical protein
VRVRLIPDYEEFYSRFVLDFLEAEHLHANDSLVTLLKNGTPKVFRGDLKNRYRLSKDFLFEFSLQHPEVLKAYKETLPAKAKPLDSAVIEGRQAVPREPTNETAVKLAAIPAGREHASEYHDLILGVLNQVFYPWLTRPQKEQAVDEGRKRIDILYRNSSEEGFFSRLVNHYKIHCPFVSVECKNYSEDPANPELDQLMGRLSRKRGYFGMLVCRGIKDSELMLKRLQDVVNNNSDRLVMVLEDRDIASLLKLKSGGKSAEISEYLDQKLQPVPFASRRFVLIRESRSFTPPPLRLCQPAAPQLFPRHARQVGLEIEDGRAVEHIHAPDVQSPSLAPQEFDDREPNRIRAVRGARREDAVRTVVARRRAHQFEGLGAVEFPQHKQVGEALGYRLSH